MLTSLQNPKIKEAAKLWKRRERDERGLFLVEGYRELSRALEAKATIIELFICESLFLGQNEYTLIAALEKAGTRIYPCTESVFCKLSYRDRPDGLIGTAPHFTRSLDELKKTGSSPFYIIAEGIEKPGNLGTILRSADATGVHGVAVCDRRTDIHNPNVVRASVGTLFTVPVVESDNETIYHWLKSAGVCIVSATHHAEKEYTKVDFTQGVAIAVGAEQYGLSPFWMEKADLQVKIPMFGRADSLNVSTATTLLLYEAVRQRRSLNE